MKPANPKAPGWWVESLDKDGNVLTSVPPTFAKSEEAALSWMHSEIDGASSAPADWAAARIVEVRLTWVRPETAEEKV